jgi:hypothetical protein
VAQTEGLTYTATENGWLYIQARSTSTEHGYAMVFVNNSAVISALYAPLEVAWKASGNLIPIHKGDVIGINLTSGQLNLVTFFPNV